MKTNSSLFATYRVDLLLYPFCYMVTQIKTLDNQMEQKKLDITQKMLKDNNNNNTTNRKANKKMSEKYRTLLQQNNKLIKQQIEIIQKGLKLEICEQNQKQKQLRKDLIQLVKHVAKTGQLVNDLWPEYRNFITIVIKETLDRFQDMYKDSNSFIDQKQVILQYMVFFDKPPFTIQRISQLTLQPDKYYRSSKKLLYAYQKLVNVSDPEQK